MTHFAYAFAEEICKSLIADIKNFTQKPFITNNEWESASSPQLYHNQMEGYTTFIYALGSRSVESINVRRAFCYVIAVGPFFVIMMYLTMIVGIL